MSDDGGSVQSREPSVKGSVAGTRKPSPSVASGGSRQSPSASPLSAQRNSEADSPKVETPVSEPVENQHQPNKLLGNLFCKSFNVFYRACFPP